MPEHELLTTAEVAKLFRIGRAAISKAVKENRLPAVRLFGGRSQLRFRRADIERMIAG